MKSKLFATIALTAALSAGAMGMAACKPEENKTDVNPDIYAIYTAYAEEEGENALSYEEWYAQLLATAKGDKGDKGDKGAQGPAGTNGKSAYEIWLEQEGNEDKSVEEFLASLKGADGAQGLKGDDGDKGDDGERGNKIYHGKGDPKSLDLAAEEGDMYVDTKGWHVYFYESGEWKDYGAISGETKPEEKVIKEFKAQKLSSTEKFTADLAEVENGEYYVVVDTGSEAAVNTVIANFTTGKAQFFKADMYMPESKEYRCFFNYNGNPITGLDITTTSVEEITADIKIVEYKAPQVALDTPTEVSMNHISHGYAQIKVASELANQEVAIEIDLPTTITKAPTIYNSTLTSNKPTKIKDMTSLGTQDKYYAQITVPEDCIIYIGDGLSTLYCYNGILTITAVS